MGKVIDLVGRRFGRLVVLSHCDNKRCQGARWNCVCDCGKSKVIAGSSLKGGLTKSCGCLSLEMLNRTRMLTKPIPFSERTKRFWSKVAKGEGCWIWTGGTSGNGYGAFMLNGKHITAHRFSWILHRGEPRLHILHKCDNPICVNPDHLFEGTNLDNIKDRVSKGRSAKNLPGCLQDECGRGEIDSKYVGAT